MGLRSSYVVTHGNSGRNHFQEYRSIISRRRHKAARCRELPAFSNVLGGVPGAATGYNAQLVRRLRGTRGWNDPARRYFMTRTREHEDTDGRNDLWERLSEPRKERRDA